MNDHLKLNLAKKLINCVSGENGTMFICGRCPIQDACDELFVVVKRRFLPTKSEAEVKAMIEIIEDRRKSCKTKNA